MLLSTAACHRLTENEHVPGPVLLFPQNEAGKYLQLDLENINSKKKTQLINKNVQQKKSMDKLSVNIITLMVKSMKTIAYFT